MRASRFHLFQTDFGLHIMLVNGSQIFGLPNNIVSSISSLIKEDNQEGIDEFLHENGLNSEPQIDDISPLHIPVHALSLAVAQKCNLGCTYCYAQEGDFGGAKKNMELNLALVTVDRLLAHLNPGERANLAFLGGEPLVNRSVIQEATKYAYVQAKEKNIRISFSITTNGTLLRPVDVAFFEEYGFAVTISIDGIGDVNDQLRFYKGGRGSYVEVINRVTPLLQQQHKMQVSARVTVTPQNLYLKQTLDELIRLGFHSVGFSPMLSSPTKKGEMYADSLNIMLEQMIECGKEFEKNIIEGKRYPFSNMSTAMREIHKGTHRPYPCGAGAGYMGVSSDGDLYACHRFVNDDKGYMGNVTKGINLEKQKNWMLERHVHFQEPCNNCWARYLCAGGCHHEVINRGRPACNYIKSWLSYNLKTYISLLERAPGYFNIIN
ncbi:MAG: SPASM domain-containing protein [Planctomycetes bacterium]|nr:SPASM domain-containing protein [Planctomycetota bacterium]